MAFFLFSLSNYIIYSLQDLYSSDYKQILQMIQYVYAQQKQVSPTPFQLFFCSSLFAVITTFFYLSFMNICFQTFFAHPPLPLTIILFVTMGLDILAFLYYYRKLTIQFFVDLSIFVMLVLSWSIKSEGVIYMSVVVFVKLPEILRFNNIIQNQVRSFRTIFTVYTVLKIIYVYALFGHFLACILYLIDVSLINSNYYGYIYENPSMYFQGASPVYTSIYTLDEKTRYLYCIYYIYSLFSVAYADILGRNPIEDVYICVIIILSTSVVAFILQQMVIVLRENRYKMSIITKKLTYFDTMLTMNSNISSFNRFKLISFLFYTLKYQMNYSPDMGRLSESFHSSLVGESIGAKKLITKQKLNQRTYKTIFEQYNFPPFLLQYLLCKFKLRHIPSKHKLINNREPLEPINLSIVLQGSFILGYGRKGQCKKQIRQKVQLLGWRQYILRNKQIHQEFWVQSYSLCEAYVLDSLTLHQLIREQKQKNHYQDSSSCMLEQYEKSKQHELFLLWQQLYQPQQNFVQDQKPSIQNELEQIQHNVACWVCGKKSHQPLYCPFCHYKPKAQRILSSDRLKQQRKFVFRRNYQRKKISKEKEKVKLQDSKEEKGFLIKNKIEQIHYLISIMCQDHQLESYKPYQAFYPSFNISNI